MCSCQCVRCDGLVDTDPAKTLAIALAAVVGYIPDDSEIVYACGCSGIAASKAAALASIRYVVGENYMVNFDWVCGTWLRYKAAGVWASCCRDFPTLDAPVALVNPHPSLPAVARAYLAGVEGCAFEPCDVIFGSTGDGAPLAAGEVVGNVGCSGSCQDYITAVDRVIWGEPGRIGRQAAVRVITASDGGRKVV